ncbi:MAG TPA: AAA family ATPase [Bacilli bacterium]|nr:AAA family ATPase [Bacilli bacterium]
MISFDQTFEVVRQTVSTVDLYKKLSGVTCIRDVYGKITLYLELVVEDRPSTKDLDEMKSRLFSELETKLGAYFGQDIWIAEAEGKKDLDQYLGNMIVDQRVKTDWRQSADEPEWYILERHVSKKAWTKKRAGQPPWSFELAQQGHRPKIVSFFSFKGGMGRTTALAATALTMARKGHRVAIVDLDLEAPGLSSLFFAQAEGGTGVVDYLLEKRIQKERWKIHSSLQSIAAYELMGNVSNTIYSLPAGEVNTEYLEKLARLDFQHIADKDDNLAESLQGMLEELDRVCKDMAGRSLDFIFLDARAGFHDIGGLAVADLSHASVIFGNNSHQTWVGLEQVIRRLARHDEETDAQSVLLAHAMAPAVGVQGREEELKLFREKAYDVFMEQYYTAPSFETGDIPNTNDPDAPFTPVVLPWQDVLRGNVSLFLHEDSASEKTRIIGLVDKLTNESYQELAKRICLLFGIDFDRGGE